MKMFRWFGAMALVAFSLSAAVAEDVTEVVLAGLTNPCGVAVQPGTGDVFVSDSAAGRVIRVRGGKAEDVITGFPQDVYGKGPMYNIGPLGLTFLDQNTLVVGGGGHKDGAELLRVYTVGGVDLPISADQMKAKLGPLVPTGDIKGEGNFYGIAATKSAIFASSNGDDTKGWVAKVEIKDGKFGKLKRFIATKELVEVDAPVAVAIGTGGEVVIGQMGEITIPGDSLLSFYNANNGKLLLNLETGLDDITALAYSTKTKRLFALDFAWLPDRGAGLYRLDKAGSGANQSIDAIKITALDKPSAMAFAPDGTLYVTVFGTAKDGDANKPGKLLKLHPGL